MQCPITKSLPDSFYFQEYFNNNPPTNSPPPTMYWNQARRLLLFLLAYIPKLPSHAVYFFIFHMQCIAKISWSEALLQSITKVMGVSCKQYSVWEMQSLTFLHFRGQQGHILKDACWQVLVVLSVLSRHLNSQWISTFNTRTDICTLPSLGAPWNAEAKLEVTQTFNSKQDFSYTNCIIETEIILVIH